VSLPPELLAKTAVRRPSRSVHGIARVAPAVVWVAAIVAALGLYRHVYPAAAVVGHAAGESLTLCHLEPGVVRAVHVALHQDVEPGQIVVAMDDREERIELAALQKELEQMRAEVLAEEAKLTAEGVRVTTEEEDLERRFLLDREMAHLTYLEALRQEAEDAILKRGAAIELDIVAKLYDDEFVSFRELNTARTGRDALTDKLETHESVVARARRAYEDADRRWLEFAERPAASVHFDEVLTPLRLAGEVGAQRLEEIVRRIDAHVIRSPIEGQVTQVFARPGERLAAGAPLVEVSATRTGRVVAYLPERSAMSLGVGDRVMIRCVAPAKEVQQIFEGTVQSLASVIEEAPPRYRLLPNRPVWGRGLVVALNGGATLMPGEAVNIHTSSATP